MKRFRGWLYPWLVLALAPFVLLSPVILSGKALFWGTPALQFVPWRELAWRTVRAGHLPLWNPWVGMGAPLLANYQSGLLYPLNWLYFLLSAWGGITWAAWGQAVLVAFHLSLAAVGMGLLARQMGLGRLAQGVSGLAFGLSGYLVARAGFLSINAAAAWVPWVLLFSMGSNRVIPLAVVLALQLLAGHAQTAWYTLLLAGVWVLLNAWRQTARREATILGIVRGVWMASRRYLGALLLAVCLSAVQLFPTGEYLLQSQRASSVAYETAMTYSFWPWRFLSLFAPQLFGNPVYGDYWGYANYWEDAVYIGLLPILLAIWALCRGMRNKLVASYRKKRGGDGADSGVSLPGEEYIPFLGMMIALSFLLALGKNTPVFPWLYEHVPTFDLFQAPTRFTLWAEFSLAVLAGIGVDHWRRPEGRGLYWTRLGIAGGLAIIGGALFAWSLLANLSLASGRHPSLFYATAMAGFLAVVSGILALKNPRMKPHQEKTARATGNWHWVVLLFVLGDLLFANWGLNPGISRQFYAQTSNIAGEFHSLTTEGRLLLLPQSEHTLKYNRYFRFDTFNPTMDWSSLRAIMLPNINIIDRVPVVNNFDPMVPGRYARWEQRLSETGLQGNDRLLNLMGIKMVGFMDTTTPLGVAYQVYPPEASRRARWVPCGQIVPDGDIAWEKLVWGEIDVDRTVLLEGQPGSVPESCEAGEGEARIVSQDENPNMVHVTVSATTPGWIVLSDVWYPGWQAWVDGSRVKLWRANHLFRAVEAPAGEHEIVFHYRPLSFWAGLALSVLSWVGLLFTLILRPVTWFSGESDGHE